MSNARNKTHKRNIRKKKTAFENTKASFVAGIVVVITILNDAISLLISIPRMVEWMEVAICLLLFYLALGTKKLNHILNRIGVEKFGSFLTVYSVIIFLLEKTLISQMANIELVISLSNEKFQAFIMFLLLGLVGIGGAIYLLLCKYPKDA